MQIPKFLLMFCVAALGLSTLQAQRVDTEEQAKARELLRKKMAELDAQQPVTQPQQPAKPAPEPAATPKKPKVKKAAPKPAPDAAAAPVVTPPPAVAAPPQPVRLAPYARAATSAPVYTAPAEVTPPLSPEAEAKVREELHRKTTELGPSVSAPPRTTTTPAPKAASKPTVARKKEKKTEHLVFDTPAPTAPVERPIPSAVPGAKNQKLAELLTRYRSNAITPEEYHKKRAEILAQP
jgi:hypothetical protein